MAKVGRFVTDPRAGGYCQLTLDSGEKLLVSHEKTGKSGKVTISRLTLWELTSEPIFEPILESPEGQAVLLHLTAHAVSGSADATPLGAFVNTVKDCDSLAAVRAKCVALQRRRE